MFSAGICGGFSSASAGCRECARPVPTGHPATQRGWCETPSRWRRRHPAVPSASTITRSAGQRGSWFCRSMPEELLPPCRQCARVAIEAGSGLILRSRGQALLACFGQSPRLQTNARRRHPALPWLSAGAQGHQHRIGHRLARQAGAGGRSRHARCWWASASRAAISVSLSSPGRRSWHQLNLAGVP